MSGGSFKALVGALRQTLAGLPDRRTGANLSYAMEDFGLSAFANFCTQSPSFLAHQRAMQTARTWEPSSCASRPAAHGTPMPTAGPTRFPWCELTVTDPEGKVLYHNAWITDWPITEKDVEAVVASGRARWKIENKNNNTLTSRPRAIIWNRTSATAKSTWPPSW